MVCNGLAYDMHRDRHVQPIWMNLEFFFNFNIFSPLFDPGDSENRIENFFGAL